MISTVSKEIRGILRIVDIPKLSLYYVPSAMYPAYPAERADNSSVFPKHECGLALTTGRNVTRTPSHISSSGLEIARKK